MTSIIWIAAEQCCVMYTHLPSRIYMYRSVGVDLPSPLVQFVYNNGCRCIGRKTATMYSGERVYSGAEGSENRIMQDKFTHDLATTISSLPSFEAE